MSDLQRTPEWYRERCGCLTGSRVADALAVSKRDGKPLKARQDLLLEILAERLTGEVQPHITTAAMQWGIDHEDEAREAYELASGEVVEETGFVRHPLIDRFGASPDGLVGDDGLVEIKCPGTATHVYRLMTPGAAIEAYRPQLLAQLACTGRSWVDMVDYDPRIQEPALRLRTERFTPGEGEMEAFLAGVQAFLEDVDAAEKAIRGGA